MEMEWMKNREKAKKGKGKSVLLDKAIPRIRLRDIRAISKFSISDHGAVFALSPAVLEHDASLTRRAVVEARSAI